MNWKAWFKGLGAAASGGASAGAATALGTGQYKSSGYAAIGGAVATVIAYLLQSPIKVGGQEVQVVVKPAEPKPEEKK